MARHLELDKYRRLLEEERDRIAAEIEDLQSDVEGESGAGSEASELSHYDEHQGDAGTEMFVQERDLALEENAEAILRQVEGALQKIQEGGYGTCERCGKPIAAARLQAIPYTPFCIECATRLEGRT
jgi:RNA polymerase-binding transcription factor DksA